MKYFILLAVAFVSLLTSIIPVYAQYVGDKVTNDNVLGECIGGPGMCPEQQLVQRLENDQKNVVSVLIAGIPFLVFIGFIIWRKRK